MKHHGPASVLSTNLLWVAGAVVFFFVPAYLFVVGRDNGPFSRLWFLNSEERARYAVIFKRMFIWFVSAGATGLACSLVLGRMGWQS